MSLSALRELIQPPPPAERRLPADQIPATYHYWRQRQLWSSYLGYAVFYTLRKNIPVAAPLLTEELGISIKAFGVFFMLHDLTYGFAKFVSGLLADRFNP